VSRLSWTIGSNLLLLGAAFKAMRRADTVLFTGSPPLMVHFIAPLNLLLGKQLIYRITDFHPECLIAERGRSGPVLDLLLSLTQSGLQKATGSEHSRRYRSTYLVLHPRRKVLVKAVVGIKAVLRRMGVLSAADGLRDSP